MEKDNYLSTAKGLAIILMVVGHAISQNFAYRFIYMFHMPLFFFCSGYFYKDPSSLKDVGHFAIKRVKGLYLPFVKWGIVFWLFHNLFCEWHLYDSTILSYSNSYSLYRLKLMVLTMTGQERLLAPLWFLKALMLSSIFVCVVLFGLRKVVFKNKDLLLWLSFFFLTIVSKFYKMSFIPPVLEDFSLIFLSATFFFTGYLYRKVENNNYYSIWGVLVSFITIFIFVWVWDDSLDMLWYNENNIILYIPMALLGIYMSLSVSWLIERWTIKFLLYYIGKNTLIILVLHLLVFKFVNLIKIYVYGMSIEKLADFMVIHEYNDFFWFVYSLMGCALPLAFDFIIKKGRKMVVEALNR